MTHFTGEFSLSTDPFIFFNPGPDSDAEVRDDFEVTVIKTSFYIKLIEVLAN